jgi:hypothetical protein
MVPEAKSSGIIDNEIEAFLDEKRGGAFTEANLLQLRS